MKVFVKTDTLHYRALLLWADEEEWGYCLQLYSGWRLFGFIPVKRAEGRQLFAFPSVQ